MTHRRNLRNMKKTSLSTLLLILAIIFAVGGGLYSLSTVEQGYTTGYQGAKAKFYGVLYEGFAYEGRNVRGTSMNFDPDDPETGLPNIEGEMTSVFIPEDVKLGDVPSFIPDEWAGDLPYIDNPDEVFEWTTIDEDDNNHIHRMEKWLLKYYVSLEAGYDSSGVLTHVEGNNKRIHDTEVWIELDLEPTWVFENADRTYFGIGKIQCSAVKVSAHKEERVDFFPESVGSPLTIFYNPYGEPIDLDEDSFEGYAVDGTLLNPAIFRDKVYTMVSLYDFGTQGWLDGLSYKNQGDIVTWEFTIHVFVVGEWITKDVQEVPEDYERASKIQTTGFDFKEWVSTPNGMLTMAFIILVTIAVVIIFIAISPTFANLSRAMANYSYRYRRVNI
jgi:hypothetical protein